VNFRSIAPVPLPIARAPGEDEAMRTASRTFVLVLAAAFLPLAATGRSVSQHATPEQKSAARPENRVDLNHATLEQLLKVPGMTRTWAQRIIRFRPYRSKQDLVDEGILPSGVYSRIRDYVIAHREQD